MSETVATATPEAASSSQEGQGQELPKDVPNARQEAGKQAKPSKFKIADYEFASENDAKSEVERGRQSGKLLTEAQKRLEASAKKEREFEEKRGLAKKDFSKAVEALGLSHEEAVELMSKYLYDKEIMPKQMSPEQKKYRAIEEENKRLKAERENETKAKTQAEFQEKVKGEVQKLRGELQGLLDAKKIPGTRIAMRRLATYLKSYEESGVQVPAERAVDMLMSDYQQEFGELLDDASPDQLEAFLGKDKMQKLAKTVSKWAMGRLSKSAPAQRDDSGAVKSITKPGSDQKISPNDFTKFIGSLT